MVTTTTGPIMDIAFSCACGQITGAIKNATPKSASRATCYCTDCQAFSEALGKTDEVLDAQGGTAVYQTFPPRLTLDNGKENLRTMKVTEKQALRWYAGCCDTPIAFTATTKDVPILGLVERNLTPSDASAMPPQEGAFFPQEAWSTYTGKKASFPKLALAALGRAFKAKLTGEKGPHPLFGEDGSAPEPRVLRSEERAAIDASLANRRQG